MAHETNEYCWAAAHHEAGHALSAVLVGNIDITAHLSHRDLCIGRVTSLGPARPDPSTTLGRSQLYDIILVAWSGHVAERLYWRTAVKPPAAIGNWSGDLATIQLAANQLATPSMDANAIEQAMMNFAMTTLLENEPVLTKLATELHGRMTLDDASIRSLCQGAQPRKPYP